MIPALFLTPLFKVGATAAVAIILVGSCALRDSSLRKEGATTERADITRQSNEQGTKAAKRAAKVIRDAHAPGSFDRLRKDPRTCPDCDR
jgi:hypothetical protein